MGLIASWIARSKGKSGYLWFLTGFLLGPIGILLALLVPSSNPPLRDKKRCPRCGRKVDKKAFRCPYCGYDFTDLNNIPEAEVIDDE